MEPNTSTTTERLWTPWRMRYIAGEAKEDGCIFCNRLRGRDDVQSLILHRGHHAFVIMNLFPYNTGHVMIVPNQHAADPEDLDIAALHEIGELLPLLTRVLRRVFACAGFNIGMNIGSVAGAGVAAHLHQHVVPRWVGDANFMPILASTMAIPELIPATYAKIRAELHRELTGTSTATAVILDHDNRYVLVRENHLPTIDLHGETPVWKALAEHLPDSVTEIEIAGWGGERQAAKEPTGPAVLTLRIRQLGELPDGWKTCAVDANRLAPADRAAVLQAIQQLAPAVAGPS